MGLAFIAAKGMDEGGDDIPSIPTEACVADRVSGF